MPDRLSFLAFNGPLAALALLLAAGPGCASMPEPKVHKFSFPKNAYVGDVPRPYTVLGPVRAKVDYQTLDPNHEEKDLCRNYYNKAVRDLVKFARKQGGDAVVDVKSVVFLVDGRTETYSTPECSDDGGDGQILAQGVAVKWKGGPVETGAWTQPAQPGRALPPPAKEPAPSVATASPAPIPSSTSTAALAIPPGATLVPDQDEPLPAVEAAKSAEAEPAPTPVTVQMDKPEPQKQSAVPGALPPSTVQPTQVSEAPRQPAAEPPKPAAPARARLPFADPRAVPGSFQRAFP